MAMRKISPDPLVWGLLGTRHGDNQQIRAVLAALGWRHELKKLHYNHFYMLPNKLLGPSNISLTAPCRLDLKTGCWPDIVVGVGRRSVPAARWIKAQSGGRTRLVQIGRPRAPLELFDLVVTTPQYGLPDAPNVLHNLMPPGSARQQLKPGAWSRRLQKLPRPMIGVLLGGSRWPLVLDRSAGAELGRQTAMLAGRIKAGSIVAAGGPRTQAHALDGFARNAKPNAKIHPFKKGADNPYEDMLALCDQFVVTGDSVSMIAEAAATRKPVHVFPVPQRRGAALAPLAGRLSASLLKPLASAGLFSPPRDVNRFHQRLFEAGLAVPLGRDWTERGGRAEFEDETARIVSRIKSLMKSG